MTLKFIKKIFTFSKKAYPGEKGDVSKKAIKNAADSAWEQYDKTFKDLARYDRGEKISNSLSR